MCVSVEYKEWAKKEFEKWVKNPRWRTIRHLGQLPILGISAATIVFVPLLSRSIDFLQDWSIRLATSAIFHDHLLFGMWLQGFSQSLTLPFVLKLLALSAVCAIIGKIIYILRCPPYIKYGDSFDQFRHAHSDALMVMTEAFCEVWNASNEEGKIKIVRYMFNCYGLDFFNNISGGGFVNEPIMHNQPVGFRLGDLRGGARSGELITLMNNPILGEAIFVLLRDSRDDIRRRSRILCAVVYYAATVLAVVVIGIQGVWVFRGIFS
jgi:hypothetical protein